MNKSHMAAASYTAASGFGIGLLATNCNFSLPAVSFMVGVAVFTGGLIAVVKKLDKSSESE